MKYHKGKLAKIELDNGEIYYIDWHFLQLRNIKKNSRDYRQFDDLIDMENELSILLTDVVNIKGH